MKLTKGKISKLYNKKKQSLKKKNNRRKSSNKNTFRKKRNINLANKTLKKYKKLKGGQDDIAKKDIATPVVEGENPAEEQPVTSEVEKTIVEETPISPEETPIAAEETPIAPEETPIAAEETPIAAEETPIAAEETPIAAEETPIAAEETPIAAEETPIAEEEPVNAIEEQPAEEEPVISETETTIVDEAPAESEVPSETDAPFIPDETTPEMPDAETKTSNFNTDTNSAELALIAAIKNAAEKQAEYFSSVLIKKARTTFKDDLTNALNPNINEAANQITSEVQNSVSSPENSSFEGVVKKMAESKGFTSKKVEESVVNEPESESISESVTESVTEPVTKPKSEEQLPPVAEGEVPQNKEVDKTTSGGKRTKKTRKFRLTKRKNKTSSKK